MGVRPPSLRSSHIPEIRAIVTFLGHIHSGMLGHIPICTIPPLILNSQCVMQPQS